MKIVEITAKTVKKGERTGQVCRLRHWQKKKE
jgi:hypothetical protein